MTAREIAQAARPVQMGAVEFLEGCAVELYRDDNRRGRRWCLRLHPQLSEGLFAGETIDEVIAAAAAALRIDVRPATGEG
jgi:hypothetical protein